jgi:hypothetical protein
LKNIKSKRVANLGNTANEAKKKNLAKAGFGQKKVASG